MSKLQITFISGLALIGICLLASVRTKPPVTTQIEAPPMVEIPGPILQSMVRVTGKDSSSIVLELNQHTGIERLKSQTWDHWGPFLEDLGYPDTIMNLASEIYYQR